MSEKNDWEELEAWQKKKDLEDAKRFDKKERTDAQRIIGMKQKMVTSSDIKELFTTHLDVVVVFILIIVVAIIFAFIKNATTPVTVEHITIELEKRYGQSFCQIGEDVVDQDGTIHYELRNDKEPIVYFKGERTGNNIKTDYAKRSFETYFNNWNHPEKEKMKVGRREEDGFLEYFEVYFEIDSMDKLDDAVRVMYDFYQFAGSSYLSEWGFQIRNQGAVIFPLNEPNLTQEQALERTRYNYVTEVIKAGVGEEFSNEVMKKYWKPNHLEIKINGETLKNESGIPVIAMFENDGTVRFTMTKALIQKIPDANYTTDKGEQYLEYKGKSYKIVTEYKKKENTIPTQMTEEEFNQFFGATSQYDYQNQIIELIIP